MSPVLSTAVTASDGVIADGLRAAPLPTKSLRPGRASGVSVWRPFSGFRVAIDRPVEGAGQPPEIEPEKEGDEGAKAAQL